MQEFARGAFSWFPGFLILIPFHLAEVLPIFLTSRESLVHNASQRRLGSNEVICCQNTIRFSAFATADVPRENRLCGI